jgi:hypothetical protein
MDKIWYEPHEIMRRNVFQLLYRLLSLRNDTIDLPEQTCLTFDGVEQEISATTEFAEIIINGIRIPFDNCQYLVAQGNKVVNELTYGFLPLIKNNGVWFGSLFCPYSAEPTGKSRQPFSKFNLVSYELTNEIRNKIRNTINDGVTWKDCPYTKEVQFLIDLPYVNRASVFKTAWNETPCGLSFEGDNFCVSLLNREEALPDFAR